MILGDMLQQMYNITDTLIVGRCIATEALAAVGSAYALMTFLNSVIFCKGITASFLKTAGNIAIGSRCSVS